MASTESTASFSSLPSELRIRVFRHILPTGTSIKVRVNVKRRRENCFPGRYLRVSKLFNNEAGQILYAENHFYLRNLYTGMVFLRRIGKTNSSYVKCLEFGTFWLSSRDACRLTLTPMRNMHYDYNRQGSHEARQMVVDEIAQCTPSITCLTLHGVGYNYQRSFLKMLESCSHLMKKMPMLANIHYNARGKTVVLDAQPVERNVSRPSEPYRVGAANIRRWVMAMSYSTSMD